MAASKLPEKGFTLSQVLDMLDLGDSPDKACNITVIPQTEKDAFLSDCDSDGSDMDYEGESGHLPAKLLNAYPELQQTDHDRNNVINDDDDIPLTTTPSTPPSTVHDKEPVASMSQKVQSEKPRAKLQVVKNKD
ncbi:hypothetical protein CgunFtcFv8_022576 [Champsocephalus gunnari]|uniref:Uncharacterized protein n=1 Tax=Champsocephalus gunnari TaxID=52237 RepID=A0AAN8DRG9_CHAGU|nr:hypothetical protein CgunFtcFv8_022576 [Champsocephalus gunnari]